jgi:preprotein translocase subunit SecD
MRRMRRRVGLLLLAAAVAVCGVIALAVLGPSRDGLPLDRTGGVRLTYTVVPVGGRQPTARDLELERTVVANRIRAAGVAVSSVRLSEVASLVVDLNLLTAANVDQVRSLVGTTGRLDFVPLGQTPAAQDQQLPDATIATRCDATLQVNCVLFSGDRVAAAKVGASQTGQRTVDFTLSGDGKQLFADYTSGHVGDYFAVVLDGKVITAPVINEAIPGGQVQISQGGIDGFPLAAARNLVIILQSGQLLFPLRETSFNEVTPAP